MTFSDPDEQRLHQLLSQAPPTPDIVGRVRGRLRRRRMIRLTLAAATVLLLVLSQLSWRLAAPPNWPNPLPPQDSVAQLLWQPPVEKLDVIDQQRDALLSVLQEMGQE